MRGHALSGCRDDVWSLQCGAFHKAEVDLAPGACSFMIPPWFIVAKVVPDMKLRAQLTIDIDTEDFVSAADHQKRVHLILHEVKKDYPHATARRLFFGRWAPL
jgi:hypothetical protein